MLLLELSTLKIGSNMTSVKKLLNDRPFNAVTDNDLMTRTLAVTD